MKNNDNKHMDSKTLRRSATNQVIAGVCGGIGEYFEVDPTVVRIIFVVLALASGSGLLLYALLWLLIPGPTSTNAPGENTIREGLKEMEAKVEEFAGAIEEKIDGKQDNTTTTNDETAHSNTANNQPKSQGRDMRSWAGIILVFLGSWFLLSNFGFFRFFDLGKLWPLILIFFGVYYLTKRR